MAIGELVRSGERTGSKVRIEPPNMITADANEAVAGVAYRASEMIAVYPITPSSPMGEWADEWATKARPNLWGQPPRVVEMQGEGGAAGALHGALQAGALATTFTSSQGLLLMLPNMFKIAGELTPTVFHVAARTLATHALSIFGDHSDVMAVRQSGWAMLASSSVQEAQDFAAIAHASTLRARVPFLHFFDGFRTSHEVMKISPIADETLRAMIDDELVYKHRARGLAPEHPHLAGSAQNPDVFFQAREAGNPYYLAVPGIVQSAMDQFADLTGRRYRIFEYEGAPDATHVIIAMGSGSQTASETAKVLNRQGRRVGVLTIRLFRPFSVANFVHALPATVERIAVLDRSKEPGAIGDPLYQDVVTAIIEAWHAGTASFSVLPRVIGGRYGLASKEFTPAMAVAVFDVMERSHPPAHFTIGIHDDVTGLSIPWDPSFSIDAPDTVSALFYGLGSDGTVGANKNSIKIIGETTPLHAQGYFVYDSKKSGSVTISHLRFGTRPIRAPYLISAANFIACHQFQLLDHLDVLGSALPSGTFLLNSPYGPDEVWAKLPHAVRDTIASKRLRFFVIDGDRVARETGMARRINTVMQSCFFALSGILPRDEAIAAIRHSIEKTYGKRGERVVAKNFEAVDAALANLHEVTVPDTQPISIANAFPHGTGRRPLDISTRFGDVTPGPDWLTAMLIAGRGEDLPVSAMPADGRFLTGTAKFEKRNLARELPVWDADLCIQCGKCTMICPHAAIREKVVNLADLAEAPATFMTVPAKWRQFPDQVFSLQVSPEDCTGCTLCFEICPAVNRDDSAHRALMMVSTVGSSRQDDERANWEFFTSLPETDRTKLNLVTVKDVALTQPLFEFSGACAGCGETPYLRLLTQLFGDHLIVANATGCSSIYGGSLPATPWSQTIDGIGPAWANSLFEDNAEFGLGIRVAVDHRRDHARALLDSVSLLAPDLADELMALRDADQSSERGIVDQRNRVRAMKDRLAGWGGSAVRELSSVIEALVHHSVWLVGGDGWAYDIGYGGLDHVIASGTNVNILVLDTEVYSNTGGQQSKSTPRGAVAKFASSGKRRAKKDLGLLAMTYGNVYVARIAMGANDAHTVKVLQEAEAYDGPSLVIAYAHCIAHGYDLAHGLDHQKQAVASGYWPLYRYDPRRAEHGENPFALDSRPPTLALAEFLATEDRFTTMLGSSTSAKTNLVGTESTAEGKENPGGELLELASQDVAARWNLYAQLAKDWRLS